VRIHLAALLYPAWVITTSGDFSFYSTVWQWIGEQLTLSLYSITKKSEQGTINRRVSSSPFNFIHIVTHTPVTVTVRWEFKVIALLN